MTDRYRVVVADPPWIYGNFGAKKHGSPKTHYKQLTLAELKQIPVQDWVASEKEGGCILLLWGTWPKMPAALALMAAWGFDFVTGIPWIKTSPSSGNIRTGIGFWFQSTSEFVLIGRRGKAKAPDSGELKKRKPAKGLLVGDKPGDDACGSGVQLYAPIGKHSQKPQTLHDWAQEKLKGPYLELFARRETEGWDCVGHELGWHLGPEGMTPMKEDA